jgi:hypothetical protein
VESEPLVASTRTAELEYRTKHSYVALYIAGVTPSIFYKALYLTQVTHQAFLESKLCRSTASHPYLLVPTYHLRMPT